MNRSQARCWVATSIQVCVASTFLYAVSHKLSDPIKSASLLSLYLFDLGLDAPWEIARALTTVGAIAEGSIGARLMLPRAERATPCAVCVIAAYTGLLVVVAVGGGSDIRCPCFGGTTSTGAGIARNLVVLAMLYFWPRVVARPDDPLEGGPPS